MELFGNNLRERAAELGLSLAEAGRRCGISERRFTNYVNGTREPDLSTLVQIAHRLDTSPDTLLGVNTPRPLDDRNKLLHRLQSATTALDDQSLEAVVVQVEALATWGRASGG